MKLNKQHLMTAALLLAANLCTTPLLAEGTKTPAFPGAEGYGRYTTGGRGGNVYAVTNLNDAGEGSLRWALSQKGPRTIVFNVDGTIHLQSPLKIPSNTTLAGQTAPGMGVCVADYPFSIEGSNVIVRYMRIRLGNKNVLVNGADGWDGFGGYEQTDIIIDHCSVSWSIDECLSVYGNINTTVQWCIAAQSLVNSGHSKGAHGYGCIWGGSGASFHHNLLAHHSSRSPRLGGRPWTQLDERIDMRNNVFYNWAGEGSYGYEAQKVNIVNNYFKQGPGTATQNASKRLRVAAPGIRTTSYVQQYPAYEPALHIWGKYYVDGNANFTAANKENTAVRNNNWNYVYSQIDGDACDGTYTDKTKDTIKLAQPIPFVHTTSHLSANYAYAYVTEYAGACKGGVHDAVDEQVLNDTKKGTATATGEGLGAGFINTQDDNTAIVAKYGSAWPTLTEGEKWTDTDGDGMPDSWETANKLNPNDATDGNATTLSTEGYTNLEVYMNSLVADITAKCTELNYNGGTLTAAEVVGQEDVPESSIGKQGGGSEEPTVTNAYAIQSDDANVGPGLSITAVEGITATFDDGAWEVGGSQSAATTSDGVALTGKYATNSTTNGLKVTFATTQAGTLSIFFGGDIPTNKKLQMTDNDGNGLTATVISTGAQVPHNTFPTANIAAWDGVNYTLQANKTYTFCATGTKWRFAGFRFVADAAGISSITADGQQGSGAFYTLQGVRVSQPQRGIYIRNGKKVIVR